LHASVIAAIFSDLLHVRVTQDGCGKGFMENNNLRDSKIEQLAFFHFTTWRDGYF